MVVRLGQQYNVEEKPTVILYTSINRHAGTPKTKQKQRINSTSLNRVAIIYKNSAIEPYNNRGLQFTEHYDIIISGECSINY